MRFTASKRPARAPQSLELPTCEGRQSIDLAYLRLRGLLEVGRYTTLTWSRWGEETGSIGLIAQQDGVRLNYRSTDREGVSVHIDELVPFVSAAAGSRP